MEMHCTMEMKETNSVQTELHGSSCPQGKKTLCNIGI